jgi:parallel beta-helix repeat protein
MSYSLAYTGAQVDKSIELSLPVNTSIVSVKDSDYGAVGDGSTDDTTAIQSALDSGYNVYFPPTSNHYAVDTILTAGHAGQVIYGAGILSKIVQSGTNANSGVFRVSSKAGVVFRDLYCVPGTTTAATTNGYGFEIVTSDYCEVRNCRVTDHRRGAVMLQDSNYCKVIGNTAKSSVVNPAADNHTQAGYDFVALHASSYNIFSENHSIDGCGIGIAVQSIDSGDVASHNIITNNVIEDAPQYGIMVYRGNLADSIKHNVIDGNTIDTVDGDIEHSANGFIYGAGIYVQGAEYSVVSNNSIRNTNINTVLETLAPGAIGVTNCREITITGNMIQDPVWYGICLFDPNQNGIAGGTATVIGNIVQNSTSKSGIYVKDFPKAIIKGNKVNSHNGHGILANEGSTTDNDLLIIEGNECSSNGATGINIVKCDHAIISNNRCDGNSTHGIATDAIYSAVIGNICENNTTRGIQIISNVTGGVVGFNRVDGNDYGFSIGGPVRLIGNDAGSNTTANWAGANQLVTTHVATGSITQLAHEDRINLLGEVGGDALVTLTLPEATGSGAVFKFIVSVVNTSSYVIATADAANCGIYGTLNILDVDSNAQTAYAGVATDDKITLNGTTTGGQIGDWIEFTDIATDQWSVRGNLVCPAGSSVADPFSST